MANYQSAYTGAQIDTAVANVSTLQSDVSTLQSDVSALQSDVSTITSTIANHKNFIYSYENVTGNGGLVLQCRKYGPLVQVNINATATSAIAAWSTVGTLPEKYRPRNQVFADNPLNSGQGFYIGSASTGVVQTNAAIASGTGCWCTMTFIGNDD